MAIERNEIEKLLDMSDAETASEYRSWDKGDCSVVGLAKILFKQVMRQEIRERGEWYDGCYDELIRAIDEKYTT